MYSQLNNLWFPLQTTLQEVLSHKRVLEMLTEKASALDSDGAELATVQGIGKRYEQLVDRLLTTITQLEDSLDVFQQFTDLTKTHQDYQKQLWDRLSSLTGRSCCLYVESSSWKCSLKFYWNNFPYFFPFWNEMIQNLKFVQNLLAGECGEELLELFWYAVATSTSLLYPSDSLFPETNQGFCTSKSTGKQVLCGL